MLAFATNPAGDAGKCRYGGLHFVLKLGLTRADRCAYNTGSQSGDTYQMEATMAQKKTSRISKNRPAPSGEVIEVPTKVLRHYHVALRKGEAGYYHTDAGEYTVEGWLKVIEYGIDRYHRDGLEGADKLRGKDLDPNLESQRHAEHKDGMLRGERDIRERGDSVPPIVQATRQVLFSALKGAGVKSKDIGKLGSTVESMWEAAAKACPAVVKQRAALDAKASVIAEALDLSDIKVA